MYKKVLIKKMTKSTQKTNELWKAKPHLTEFLLMLKTVASTL